MTSDVLKAVLVLLVFPVPAPAPKPAPRPFDWYSVLAAWSGRDS